LWLGARPPGSRWLGPGSLGARSLGARSLGARSLGAVWLGAVWLSCSAAPPAPEPATAAADSSASRSEAAPSPTPAQIALLELPVGFPVPELPADNPLSSARIELGRRLFYDPRLSGPGTQACASCHRQELAFTDGRARALGATGQSHPRSAMSLANVVYRPRLGWANPELDSLEAQLRVPLFNRTPVEMGLTDREDEVFARLKSDPDYVELFRVAFPEDPDPIRLESIQMALASFERTLISGDSPYDRLLFRDEREALSSEARRGMELFFSEALACSRCHSGLDFAGPVRQRERSTFSSQVVGFEQFRQRQAPRPGASEGAGEAGGSADSALLDALFFNTGLYDIDARGGYPSPNRGLFETTAELPDMGRFRVPTLRNIEVTAPYMHDGSIASLEEVIEHYARGGRAPASQYKSDALEGFEISTSDKRALVSFLKSLTDRTFLTDPRFGDPFATRPGAVAPEARAPGASADR